MTTEDRSRMTVTNFVRVGMVIHGALILGILVFLGIVLLMPGGVVLARADSSGTPVITSAAAGFGLVALLAMMIILSKSEGMVRRMVAAIQGKVGLDVALARAMLVRTVVIGGLLEGAAIFNLTVYKLEGRALSIGVAGVLLLALASQFPTPDRASRWIERQKRRIESGAGFDR